MTSKQQAGFHSSRRLAVRSVFSRRVASWARLALPLAVAFPSVALASPEYTSAIRDHLEMSCRLQCTICHSTNEGGDGTARQPFASSLAAPDAEGEPQLEGDDVDQLLIRLDALRAAKTDSDGDGITDIDELEGHASSGSAGAANRPTDPSDPAASSDPCAYDVYGCGARLAPEPSTHAWWMVASAFVGLALVRALQRRSASL